MICDSHIQRYTYTHTHVVVFNPSSHDFREDFREKRSTRWEPFTKQVILIQFASFWRKLIRLRRSYICRIWQASSLLTSNFHTLIWAIDDSSTGPNDKLREHITFFAPCMETTLLNYSLETQAELSYDYTIKLNYSTHCLDNGGLQVKGYYKVNGEKSKHLEYS